jgi:sec-independent protein translocase protein TatA
MESLMFAFIGSLGPMEMMIVGGIALLLFGKRLPEVARSLGKGFVEFKKGLNGIEDEVNSATNYSSSYSQPSRPVPPEERAEITAPKFEPPAFTPQEQSEANTAK